MQDVSELLKEVRRIQIFANRQVNDILAGEYVTAFKGRGMEFDSVREYVPGDEIRNIDWNVTARSGVPHVKKFHEERELTVMLAIDVSASGEFGTVNKSKLEAAVRMAALLMFVALKNNDKLGLVLFADEIVQYVPPRKGRGRVLRLIRDLMNVKTIRKTADIAKALEFIGRVQRRKCVCFLLSDFQGADCARALAVANQRHDFVAVKLYDPCELALPDVGFITLQDAETGELVEVDTRHPQVRMLFARTAKARGEWLESALRRSSIDRLDIGTDLNDKGYAQSLQRFFKVRERRQR